VSISGKGGNTEKRADVPVIFFDKGIGLAVQMSSLHMWAFSSPDAQ